MYIHNPIYHSSRYIRLHLISSLENNFYCSLLRPAPAYCSLLLSLALVHGCMWPNVGKDFLKFIVVLEERANHFLFDGKPKAIKNNCVLHNKPLRLRLHAHASIRTAMCWLLKQVSFIFRVVPLPIFTCMRTKSTLKVYGRAT